MTGRPITPEDLEYLEIPAPGAPGSDARSIRRFADVVRAVTRSSGAERRRRARALARQDGGSEAVIAPYRSGRDTSYVVLHPGARTTLVEPRAAGSAPRALDAAALVKGVRGRTALLLRSAERDVCVTCLGAMARLCATLRRDGLPIDFVHATGESARLFERLDGLGRARNAALRGWLDEEEYVTDLIEGVRLERAPSGAPVAGDTTAVATSRRAAVLDSSELLPLAFGAAHEIVLEEAATRAGTFYRLRVTQESGDETAVTLAESHAAILFPLLASRSRYAVQRVDAARYRPRLRGSQPTPSCL
ncbi:MAG: hypothetical protein AAGB93_01275 [Planctomycetota bacterium]